MLPDEVQVWRLDLTCAAGQEWVEAGWDLISPDEVARARRMRAGDSRDEMVAGRAALRCLLARELECAAREVEFLTGEHGKPWLDGAELSFNVTHSQGMVLIALSRGGVVGIDVEDPARRVEALDVARTVFHPEELRCLKEACGEQQEYLFYRFWTRKEAIAKADGRGLMLSAQSFSVVEGGRGEAVEVTSDQHTFGNGKRSADDLAILDRYGQSRYHVFDFDPGRGFLAALALERGVRSIAQYDIHPARDIKRDTALVAPMPAMA